MDVLFNILRDYISKNETDYALLINGKWGSGKTYYWKHILSDKIKNKFEYKPLYISLYGVSSINEISKRIFLEVYPFLKIENKKKKAISALAKQIIINTASFFNMNKFGEGIDYDNLIIDDMKQYIICFDDIERAKIGIEEIYGYINNLVEHDNIKVIMIANEAEFREIDDRYLKLKEKIIGKTINFVCNKNEIIDNILKSYQDDGNYYDYLLKNKDLILMIFEMSDCSSFRILKQCLNDIKVVYKHINNNEINDKILDDLFKFTLTISIEIKSGIPKDEIEKISNKTFINLEDLKGNTYENTFYQKYRRIFTKNYTYIDSIIEYIISGYLNKQNLNIEIKELKNKQNTKRNKLGILFNEFWLFEDNEFAVYIDELINKANNGNLDLLTYPHLFYKLMQFKRMNLINKDLDIIKNNMIAGMDKNTKNSSYLNLDTELLPFFLSYEEEEFTNDSKYIEIKNYTLRIINNLRELEYRQKADVIINKYEDFISYLNGINNTFGMGIKLYLKYFDVNKMINLIKTLNNERLYNLGNVIYSRYLVKNAKEQYAIEYENILEFKKQLDNLIQVESKNNKLSTFLYKILSKKLENISDILK